MAASHLAAGRVNLSHLKEDVKREFLNLLDKYKGTKTIIMDKDLIRPFGLITDFSNLQDHETFRIYELQAKKYQSTDSRNVVFLTKPSLTNMNIIADYIHKIEESRSPRKEYHIIFVPRKTKLCVKMLEERAVKGNFQNLDELNLELYPMDSDVLSMENHSAFKECFVDGDYTCLFDIAKGIIKLQSLYGIIPNIYGKGDCAKRVFDLMTRLRREQAGNEVAAPPQIHNLILLDRNIDLLTPLLTQLTYEGLLDEFWGIDNNTIRLPPEKFQSGSKEASLQSKAIPTEPKVLILNSGEELYAQLRDMNFSLVGGYIHRRTKQLSAQFEERHDATTVREIKQFVDKLPRMQDAKKSLGTHTAIAELIAEKSLTEEFHENLDEQQAFIQGIDNDKVSTYIEDAIAKEEPFIKVLRLICIQSLTNNGLKVKVLDHYKREILQVYGYHHLLFLTNLEKAGLLHPPGNKVFSTFRSTLRLYIEDVNNQSPNDVATVSSGYAPMSIRLCQFLQAPGWRAISDVLSLLPGPTLEEVQAPSTSEGNFGRRRGSTSSSLGGGALHEEPRVTLVFFIGGCTFSEISALRFLSQQEDAPVEYIVGTTKLINGRTFLNSLQESFHLPP